MSNDKIDQVIAEATIAPVDAPKVEDSATEPTDQTEEGSQEAPKTEVKDPWPKSAKNKVSRLERETRILRAREQEHLAELVNYRKQIQQPQNNQPNKADGPQEDQFDNYGDYLKAVARYEAKQELAQSQPKPQEQPQVSVQEQVWVAKREDAVAEQAKALLQTNPEYQQILNDNSDILDAMPPHIERVFLEADNAPLAFIALAEEGKLESLLSMSPARAAMEIAKAETRGEAMVKAKKITSAPAPLSPNKGSGQVGKSLDAMSGKELNAWRKS